MNDWYRIIVRTIRKQTLQSPTTWWIRRQLPGVHQLAGSTCGEIDHAGKLGCLLRAVSHILMFAPKTRKR